MHLGRLDLRLMTPADKKLSRNAIAICGGYIQINADNVTRLELSSTPAQGE